MGMIESFKSPDRAFVVRWAWASLIANIGIIVTGAVVRLTASGLGCPTWPRCTPQSFVPHQSLGVHGVIEFGNRMLTYVLVVVAVATWIAVWRWAGSTTLMRRLAVALALGIPLQGVLGGITVLTNLNPWIVALHLLLSFALVSGSVLLIVRTSAAGHGAAALAPESAALAPESAALGGIALTVAARRVVIGIFAVTWIVVYLGTVVTGSGPHAGDINAPRNGIDPQVMSHVHAAAVYLLVALTLLALWLLRGTGRPFAWAVALLGVELAQGAIGFIQYWTGLPIVLVALHLLGAAVLVAVATRLLLTSTVSRSVANDDAFELL